MTAAILIIDDEPAIRRLVRGALERAGWRGNEAASAGDGLAMALRPGCELVLLDLGLPDRDGIELIPLLKAQGRSVIVLTARDATAEKVAALDLGADDYVTKPFDTDELLARIRAAMRHRNGRAGERIVCGEVTIDLARHEVTRDGAVIALTPREFALLVALARHAGRMVTHKALLREVWGEAHLDDVEYLRVVVRSLRQKLEADPGQPRLITNDPGIGYRLNGD
jgi:two-component system KDP operon response regulator KdpE